MDIQTFETIAREAVEALPEHLRKELRDVVIVIEERPEDRPNGNPAPPGSTLLGLYEGVPLTAWNRDFSGKLSDKITLFREPIMHTAGTEEKIPGLIRETVWHEIAHYFGLDHTHIHTMEQRWREREGRTEHS